MNTQRGLWKPAILHPAICLALALSLLQACGKKEEGSEGKKEWTIGFSQCTTSEPWRVLFNKELKEVAARKYPEVELKMEDALDKTENQVRQMEGFITMKVDAILISPKESAGLTDVVAQAYDAGIPVIVLDRGVNTDKYSVFVGGDNMEIGRAAGRHSVKLLEGEGKARGKIVEIWGGMGSTPAQERHKGFHEIVDKEPGIEMLVDNQDGDWKQDRGYSIMETALQQFEHIDLVYAHNDPMAYGAYLAAQDAGREDQIHFIGIDGIPNEGCKWVVEGKLSATFLYATPGIQGLEAAIRILKGEKVEKKITLPTAAITNENVESFMNR